MTEPIAAIPAADPAARLALLAPAWRAEVAAAVRWLGEQQIVPGVLPVSGQPGDATAAAGPEIGLVLGSGLGNVVGAVEAPRACRFADIPGFAAASVPGHSGQLVAGTAAGRRVVVLQGRLHPYEGLTPERTLLPIAVLACLGIRTAVVTNAAGGLNRFFAPGDLMVVRDQVDFHLRDPLRGLLAEAPTAAPAAAERRRRLWPIYSPELAARLRQAGARVGVPLHAGTYASLWGPVYETRAEIGLLRKAGCDAGGMSTAPEAALLARLGVAVAGLTCVTNPSRETGQPELSHQEVVEIGRLVEHKVAAVLLAFLPEATL